MRIRVILGALVLLTLGALLWVRSREDPLTGLAVGSEVLVDPPSDIELVEIPSGTLSREATYERHAMIVTLESFYIGKYEVTQRQWKAVMESNPAEFKGDDLPVINTRWDSVQVFMERLSEATGHLYRLPTEAEWEYACRAGSTTFYHFGEDTLRLGEYEWYDENSGGRPHPVGEKRPNTWGLYDMAGNAGEWTATIWDPAPYMRRNPGREFPGGPYRIWRGSHFLHTKYAAGCSYWHSFRQERRNRPVGFRVVREKEATSDESRAG